MKNRSGTLSVLILGEGQIVREVFLPDLRSSGDRFEVTMATTSNHALRKLGEKQWDCVILVVRMPDTCSMKVLSTLRNEQPDLPVLICTGQGVFTANRMICQRGASVRLLKSNIPSASLGEIITSAVQNELDTSYWHDRSSDLNTMLVIAKESATHESIRRFFGSTEIRTVHVFSVQEALEKLHEPFGVVVTETDIPEIIPKMDGFTWLRRIKQINPGIEIIALTRIMSRNTTERLILHGAFSALVYPLKEDAKTVETVRNALARRTETRFHELLNDALLSDIVLSTNTDSTAVPDGKMAFARHLFSELNDGVILLDRDRTVVFASLKFAQTLDIPYPEIMGRQFSEFLVQMDAAIFCEMTNELCKVRKLVTEIHLQTRTGLVLAVVVNAGFVAPDENFRGGILMVINDMTMLRKSQGDRILSQNVALKKANAELEQFTFITSHDLHEPLRGIIIFSSSLRNILGEDIPEQAKKALSFLTKSAMRMQNMVDDLLTLSRTGTRTLQRCKISTRSCADQAIKVLAKKIDRTGAVISTDALPEIWGDKNLLTQVYQNLIDNALKFVKNRKPQVRLTAEIKSGVWILGVRDNGIGIPEDYTDKIFAPCKRLFGPTEFEGTGVGLAICRKAMERLGGRIWVESELNSGTHVKFTLDYLPEDEDLVPVDR